MRTPPMLMAAALLLWGWQTGFVVFAAIMAAILECSRLLKARWEFTQPEYQRIWDLCALLFIGGVVIALSSDEIRMPLFAFIQWLPFVFFPIIAVQCFGATDRLNSRTFLWSLRRRPQSPWAQKSGNISYLYFALCIFSASAVSARTSLSQKQFYFLMAPLLLLALFSVRPKRFSRPVWTALAAILLTSGYAAHVGLQQLQSSVENAVGRWLTGFGRGELDMRESRTALGQIGKIKLSGKIVLRLETEKGPPPALLREASYDSFRHHIWTANSHEFGEADGDTNDNWTLLPDQTTEQAVRISGYLRKGEGILALPAGTAQLRELPVMTVSTNGLGLAKVTEGPGFVHFSALFGDAATVDAAPNAADTTVPDEELPVIAEIGEKLGLNATGKSDADKLSAILQFLRDEFTYSMSVTKQHVDRTQKKTPLAMFLTNARSGHCEYFATAAVLLARYANVPARYATGYVVEESPKPGRFVVRGRHAHAWGLVYTDGGWRDFDATPGSWLEESQQKASFWQPLQDFGSRIWFEFSKWRYSKTNYRQYLIWLLVPLILILVWRVLAARRRKIAANADTAGGLAMGWPGLDSEFYLVEKKLGELGFARAPGETIAKWQQRVAESGILSESDIEPIVVLHRRYRFDPNGIDASDRHALRQTVHAWLEKKNAPSAQPSTAETASQRRE